MPREYTRELAEYAVQISFSNLPREVVDQAKFVVLDALGSAIGCTRVGDEYAEIVSSLLAAWHGREEATVLGRKKKMPCVNAVLANSCLVKGLGFDDYHLDSGIHVNSVLVPAALSTAEMVDAGGREILLAVVAGYEVMARIGMSVSRIIYRGFNTTGLCGAFGCAVAAGKLLDLNRDQMVNAFGIAGVQGSGINNFRGGHMAGYFQMAKAAQNGVMAALLAKAGFTALDTILEDRRGFCTVYSDLPRLEALTRGLGRIYEIMRTSFKAYSCEIFLHPGVQALLSIMDIHGISYTELEKITLKIPPPIIPIAGLEEFPRTRFAARVTGKYVMAATAVFGNELTFNIRPFEECSLREHKIRRLFERVEVIGNKRLGKSSQADWACEVEVVTKDGKHLQHKNNAPKGHFRNPFTREDHEAKFSRLASHTLKQEDIDQIRDAVSKFEKVREITSLMEMINGFIVSK